MRPLHSHRLSWEQRKMLHERLVEHATLLRQDLDPIELREVEEAIDRLDSTAFGGCVDCGAPIAWDRLVARPQLRRCTRCQASFECGRSGP